MGFEFQLFLEIGTIMFLAFLGVILTKKLGQSVLLAYILIGVAIGPFGLKIINSQTIPESGMAPIRLDQVSGIFIYILSQMGLVLLLFFVGLEFSLSKLKRTQKPALILATFDIGINVFAGIVLGTFFGWPIIDSIFLACIMAMSSVAVTIKILEEMKRANRPETEILISLMIVEDFASIILLTTVSSFVVGSNANTYSILHVFIGIIVLFAFFIILSFVFIPTMVRKFNKIETGEAFILFALAIVFLSSAFAEFFGIAAMVGAFLMGMGFAETKLADQLKKELSSFKNVFVAIFFISFGMMIDPAVFPKVGSLIAIAVPLTIFNELLLLALVAFLIGLTAEAAISVGAGALGRSEEAIIFANLGSTLKTPKGNSILTKSSTTLAPFAGGFCLIMSTVTPLFMKASYGIANFLKRKLPTSLKFGGFLVAKMVKGMVFSVSTVRPQKRSGVATSLVAYLILILFFICCESVYGDIRFFGIPFSLFLMIILLGMLAVCIGILWFLLSLRFQAIARSLEIPNVPLNKQGKLEAIHYVNGFITGSLGIFVIMAMLWHLNWNYTIYALFIYLVVVLIATYRIYNRLVGELQWIAREDMRNSRTRKAVVYKERPTTFTYRGRSWEHRNPKLSKRK